MLDNYDSFTYNLVQYLGELGAEVRVVRNDEITLEAIDALAPERIVISPGPGVPAHAGLTVPLVRHCRGRLPILGVCLGHQGIGEAFGGHTVHARSVMHGKTSEIHHRGDGLFRGIASPFTATRYHALVIERATLPTCLEVTAWTLNEAGAEEEIMAIRHRELPIYGVQFHPESILTTHGHDLLRNFLEEPTA